MSSWRRFRRVPRVYLSYQRIVVPGGPEIGLNLFLARTRPRCVVAFCDADAAVAREGLRLCREVPLRGATRRRTYLGTDGDGPQEPLQIQRGAATGVAIFPLRCAPSILLSRRSIDHLTGARPPMLQQPCLERHNRQVRRFSGCGEGVCFR